MDRFDVVAMAPPGSEPEDLPLMLRNLLADRFSLLTHTESRPLPGYALRADNHPMVRKGRGGTRSGCASDPALSSPSKVRYECRDVTMDQFAGQLPLMAGSTLATSPIVNETGLRGKWDFDIVYSVPTLGLRAGMRDDQATFFQAIDKQLGLKLEKRKIPTPVLVVDRLREEPTGNSPEAIETLASLPASTKFEVATIKPAVPGGSQRYRIQPGGLLSIHAVPMRTLIYRAFSRFSDEEYAGLPKWIDSERYDIEAKAPETGEALSLESLPPMVLSLLVERFGLVYHEEERMIPAYSLVSLNPRIKKADPSARTSCGAEPGPPSAGPASLLLTCRNVTTQQLAEQLQFRTRELTLPILDATGLTGTWDAALTFSPIAGAPQN
ncbi:MAG: TIGR03435 family protein, partial [Acidobacteriota bacterium]|nr:TIGR03435 family protein [Acidobacteriota bacterium]